MSVDLFEENKLQKKSHKHCLQKQTVLLQSFGQAAYVRHVSADL